MSPFLLYLATRMLGLMVFATGLLLAISHATPLPPETLQGLAVCENACWIGIEPGVTAFDEVPTLVNAQRPDLVLLLQQLSASPSYAIQTPSLQGNISATRHRVGYMSLNLRIPLWRLLMLLESPTCVRTLGHPQQTTLLDIVWEGQGIALIVNIALEKDHSDLLTRSLTLWLSAYSLCEILDTSQSWPGFAAFQRQVRLR